MKTVEQLTALLAERLMGWTPAPDRFLLSNRRWMPRWRFQPFKELSDAFQLLEGAKPDRFVMGCDGGEEFWVRVEMTGRIGTARHSSKPYAITTALMRAAGITGESPE
jgi:hypothetical protein